MMAKYYLTPTIGTGTDAEPYRPKIANYECSWSAVYENPEEKNSIVAVKAEDEVFAQIIQDAEITYLGEEAEVMTNEEFQRICPDGTVMVYG